MTVKELKAKLAIAPDNMDVVIQQNDEEFGFTLVQEADVKPIKHYEDNDIMKKPFFVDMFVITDEI